MTKLPFSMRTAKTEQQYADDKVANNLLPLDQEPTLRGLDFDHWRVINNRYPYDTVLKVHHMLIPKRVVAHRMDLTLAEDQELHRILRTLSGTYDFVLENFARKRSILSHYHLHLCTYKDQRDS